jgi:prephenate dehydratase
MASGPEQLLKIGIQGVRASFHDVAARDYFAGSPLDLLECSSFRALCETLQNEQTDLAVMAIENSIAGSILPNYLLLEKFNLRIIGEVYLRIEMNLMALPGQRIADLQFVQSHPMALFQCEDFLAEHPTIKVLEHADTAESAKDIRDKKMRGTGAIASALAAEVYGLEILAKSIETNKQNFTRFLIVSRPGDEVRHEPNKTVNNAANKASMRFELSHTTGRLLGVLQIFAAHGINMTKLQSVPILGRPYEYAFHVDIEWEALEDYERAMRDLKAAVHSLIHFGEYPKAERPGV